MNFGFLIPLAHAADGYAETILVLVPTLGFIGWLAFITVRDRRRIARGEIDPNDEYDEDDSRP